MSGRTSPISGTPLSYSYESYEIQPNDTPDLVKKRIIEWWAINKNDAAADLLRQATEKWPDDTEIMELSCAQEQPEPSDFPSGRSSPTELMQSRRGTHIDVTDSENDVVIRITELWEARNDDQARELLLAAGLKWPNGKGIKVLQEGILPRR
jgi:hypothetical protein